MAGNDSIQILRGTSSKRKSSSQTLISGQPFYETDTGLLYIGENKALNSSKPINIDPQVSYIKINSVSGESFTTTDVDISDNGTNGYILEFTVTTKYPAKAYNRYDLLEVDNPEYYNTGFGNIPISGTYFNFANSKGEVVGSNEIKITTYLKTAVDNLGQGTPGPNTIISGTINYSLINSIDEIQYLFNTNVAKNYIKIDKKSITLSANGETHSATLPSGTEFNLT